MQIRLIIASILAAAAIFYAMSDENANKVTLCHATGSESNPFEIISISSSGLQGHEGHTADFILPEGETDCSGGGGGPPPD